MSVPPPPEVEQEVDFGRYWSALVSRWWLLLVGLFVGAVIGALATLGGGGGWKATSQVYLGQPLSGGSPISAAGTTLSLVSSVVASDDTIRSVAAKVGLKPSQLRGNVTAKPILGVTGGRTGVAAPLVAIVVTGSSPRDIAAASNAIAADVVKLVGAYPGAKIKTLQDRLAFDTAQLGSVNARLQSARDTQSQVLADKTVSATDKLVSLANLNSVITQALAQQIGLQQDIFGTRQDLSLAQDVEAAHIVTQAKASRAPGPGRRTAIVIGALIGLIVAVLLALLWEPLIARPRPSPLT